MSTDEGSVEETSARRKESQAQRAKRLAGAVSQVLASESGRLVLAEILGYCQVETQNGLDGMAAGRVEGARAVGLMTTQLLRKSDYAGFMRLYGEIHGDR